METACMLTRQRSDTPGREAWTFEIVASMGLKETFLLFYVEMR